MNQSHLKAWNGRWKHSSKDEIQSLCLKPADLYWVICSEAFSCQQSLQRLMTKTNDDNDTFLTGAKRYHPWYHVLFWTGTHWMIPRYGIKMIELRDMRTVFAREAWFLSRMKHVDKSYGGKTSVILTWNLTSRRRCTVPSQKAQMRVVMSVVFMCSTYYIRILACCI